MPRLLHLLPHPGGGGQRYVEQLERGVGGYRHELATLAGSSSPVRAAPALLFKRPFLAARLREMDVVHLHGDMVAMLSRDLVGPVPFVLTTHGLHFVRRARGRTRKLAQRALAGAVERSVATLCTSAAELEELARLTGGTERLVLARNGVAAPAPPRAPRAERRRELGLTDDDVVVLFAGELSERKAPLLAARSATAARAQSDVPITLLLAGEGPQRAQLEQRAGPAVRLLGFRDDIPALLAAADIFVLPSTREGLSLAVLEAMAAGLAVVVADEPGNVEAVGDAGIVVEPGDELALTAALRRLAQDPDERERLGAAARARAEREFSLDRLLITVRAAYEQALSRCGS